MRFIILLFYYCPSSGEPLNGQLGMPESTSHEDEDLHRETDILTGQATGTFPVIQPGRFPSHQPENQVPAMQPPRQNREHNWKQVGKTECTTTCGKGKCFVYAQNIVRPAGFCSLTTKSHFAAITCVYI